MCELEIELWRVLAEQGAGSEEDPGPADPDQEARTAGIEERRAAAGGTFCQVDQIGAAGWEAVPAVQETKVKGDPAAVPEGKHAARAGVLFFVLISGRKRRASGRSRRKTISRTRWTSSFISRKWRCSRRSGNGSCATRSFRSRSRKRLF